MRAELVIGAAAAGLVLLYVARKGGVAQAAASAGQAAGAAVVQAAGGAVTGVVTAASTAVGLPTPAQTTTDASVARWIIDNVGHFEASKWAGAPAYLKALMMPAGSGTPPPAGSAAARQFGTGAVTDTGDETARLLARYPAPLSNSPEQLFGAWGWYAT